MTLNNGKSVINLKITRRLSIIIFLAYLIIVYVAEIIKFPLLGMNRLAWTITVLLIFLLIILLPVILNYQYLSYSDEGENIIFRYYSTGFIAGNKNSVEINKKTFSGFKLEKKIFGLMQRITLYQRLKGGVAKYPPVYISALNREEKAKILKSLNSFAPIIKGKTQVT
jgi:uncharacterized membrane protein YdbT with pleckstrin-like domain